MTLSIAPLRSNGMLACRAQELGENQFSRLKSPSGNQRPYTINITAFDKWMKYTVNVNKSLKEAVNYFALPTIYVTYEAFRSSPVATVRFGHPNKTEALHCLL